MQTPQAESQHALTFDATGLDALANAAALSEQNAPPSKKRKSTAGTPGSDGNPPAKRKSGAKKKLNEDGTPVAKKPAKPRKSAAGNVAAPVRTGASTYISAQTLDVNTPKPRKWSRVARHTTNVWGYTVRLPVYLGDLNSPYAAATRTEPEPENVLAQLPPQHPSLHILPQAPMSHSHHQKSPLLTPTMQQPIQAPSMQQQRSLSPHSHPSYGNIPPQAHRSSPNLPPISTMHSPHVQSHHHMAHQMNYGQPDSLRVAIPRSPSFSNPQHTELGHQPASAVKQWNVYSPEMMHAQHPQTIRRASQLSAVHSPAARSPIMHPHSPNLPISHHQHMVVHSHPSGHQHPSQPISQHQPLTVHTPQPQRSDIAEMGLGISGTQTHVCR